MHYITFNIDTPFEFLNFDEISKIENLENVKELYLSDSNLSSLPENIFSSLTQLKILILSFNNLITIPISIRKCKKLLYYNLLYDIKDYQYIHNLPYLVNKEIKKYYYKNVIDYYNEIKNCFYCLN